MNSAALRNPDLIDEAARRFGAQCVVTWRSTMRTKIDGCFEVVVDGGRTPTGRDAIEWAMEAERRGAGELLVTSIDRDGTRAGFDLPLLTAMRAAVDLPIIASGGAGELADFVDVFEQAGSDAALAASLFHYGELAIVDVKRELAGACDPRALGNGGGRSMEASALLAAVEVGRRRPRAGRHRRCAHERRAHVGLRESRSARKNDRVKIDLALQPLARGTLEQGRDIGQHAARGRGRDRLR